MAAGKDGISRDERRLLLPGGMAQWEIDTSAMDQGRELIFGIYHH
jgi:hypothetical protein